MKEHKQIDIKGLPDMKLIITNSSKEIQNKFRIKFNTNNNI